MKEEALMETLKQLNTYLIISVLVNVFLVFLILVSWSELNSYKIYKTCGSFSSREDATKALKKYPNLDRDKNGIACDNLPK